MAASKPDSLPPYGDRADFPLIDLFSLTHTPTAG